MESMKNPQKISEMPMVALLSLLDAGDELLCKRMPTPHCTIAAMAAAS